MNALSNHWVIKTIFNNIIKFKHNPSKPIIIHCSYCFKDGEEYKGKLKSFEHKKFNILPYSSSGWMFKSHYSIIKMNSLKKENDEPYESWKHLIQDDERL